MCCFSHISGEQASGVLWKSRALTTSDLRAIRRGAESLFAVSQFGKLDFVAIWGKKRCDWTVHTLKLTGSDFHRLLWGEELLQVQCRQSNFHANESGIMYWVLEGLLAWNGEHFLLITFRICALYYTNNSTLTPVTIAPWQSWRVTKNIY